MYNLVFSEDEFQTLQQRYLEKYWQVFEPVEENKLIYMDIFNEYVSFDYISFYLYFFAEY